MAIWRKILSTDKKDRIKFAVIVTYVTQPVSKGHGSGNRIKFIVNHSAVEALRDHLNTLGASTMTPCSC